MESKELLEKKMEKHRPTLDEFYRQKGCTDIESKIGALKNYIEGYKGSTIRYHPDIKSIGEESLLASLEIAYVCIKLDDKKN